MFIVSYFGSTNFRDYVNSVIFRFFSLDGFCNAVSFNGIQEAHLINIEQSIRKNEYPELKSPQNVESNFGKEVAKDLRKFRFKSGDKVLIIKIAERVRSLINEFGYKYFIPISKSCDEPNAKFENVSQKRASENPESEIKNSAQYFLHKLTEAANRNSTRKMGGYRYDPEVKLFASYLRMIVGPLAYETIHRNLEAAIPSLPSTNRYIRASNCCITEGILRCEELRLYLEKRNLPFVVSLSEDATRVVDRVQYDSTTNQLIGFVPPISPINGLPIPFQYPARSANEILEHFSIENETSSNLIIIMAQPIGNAPPFCLTSFGTKNAYTAIDVSKRWTYITSELNKLGITVLTIASDSDPKYNAAMRNLSQIGKQSKFDWFSCDVDSDGPFYIQDIVHIITKLRNFLLRFQWNKSELPMGKYFIRLQHLYELMDTVGKDRHFLTPSTLNPTDRQNFGSAKRMCSHEVIRLLREKIKNSDGTIQFLQTMREIIEAFMDKCLTPLQRIRKLWYILFLIRIWRAFIISKKGLTLKNNFLTNNCYSCIEMTVHSLVLCLLRLKKINKPEWFLPHLFDSQTCESTFRQFRSMTTAYSSITNCTVKEALSRIGKIQLQNEITNTTSSYFVYPRVKREHSEQVFHQLPTPQEIYNEIILCKKTAIITAKKLGMLSKNNPRAKIFKCGIKPYETSANDRMSRNKLSKVFKRSKLKMPDLRNIQLKDFSGKLKRHVIDECSPYTEILTARNKHIIVKKTSLCWLLRKESQKISSDRLLRVRHTVKKYPPSKTTTNKPRINSTLYSIKSVVKPRQKNIKQTH